MATTEVGNGSVPATRMKALVSELRLLKSAMADMQGRLDALLFEIGTGPEHVRAESMSPEGPPDRQDDAQPQEIAAIPSDFATAVTPLALDAPGDAVSLPEQADIAPALAAEMELSAPSADEPTLMRDVEDPAVTVLQTAVVEDDELAAQVETTETILATDAETFEPNAPAVAATAEASGIEPTDAVALAEPASETPAAAQAGEIAAEPVAVADLPAETLVEPLAETLVESLALETPPVETPAAVAGMPFTNVVALADRRAAPRTGRSGIAQAGRWAAVIALIAMAVAVAAAGTGFAGHGELLVFKYGCVLAGESCSIVPGIP